jgi:hypothetical protein
VRVINLDLDGKRFFWYNANMSSGFLTSQDVAREVERLAAEHGHGYVHVIVSDGRVQRIDRCVQIKATGIAPTKSRGLTPRVSAEYN